MAIGRDEARAKLEEANVAIGLCASVLVGVRPVMDQFAEEQRRMESFGSIINPTLYRDPERRAVANVLGPLFEAAVTFLDAYETHTAKVKAALDTVQARAKAAG